LNQERRNNSLQRTTLRGAADAERSLAFSPVWKEGITCSVMKGGVDSLSIGAVPSAKRGPRTSRAPFLLALSWSTRKT
jgi:hypothetical protein